jgi:adenylate cyclase
MMNKLGVKPDTPHEGEQGKIEDLICMDNEIPAAQSERQVLLQEIMQHTTIIKDHNKILNSFLASICESLCAERGFMLMKIPELDEMKVAGTFHVEPEQIATTADISQTVINKVLDEGEAILSIDAMKDPRFQDTTSVVISGLRSILCVPVKIKKNTMGLIYIDNKELESAFKSQHLNVLLKFIEILTPFLESMYGRFRQDQIEKDMAQKRKKKPRSGI